MSSIRLRQGNLWPSDNHLRPASKPNLSGHRFKDVCVVEEYVTRWLITKETDRCQHGNESKVHVSVRHILRSGIAVHAIMEHTSRTENTEVSQ